MKRYSKLILAISVVTAVAAMSAPTMAATASTLVFTAGATVGGNTYAPILGAPVDTTFSFSTANAGIGGQKLCLGVSSAGNGTCQTAASGNFGKGAAGLGGYCGYSSGLGVVTTSKINGVDLLQYWDHDGDPLTATQSIVGLTWVNSAGTVLPTLYFDRRAGSTLTNGAYGHRPNTIIGYGSTQTTGAAPGTCGFNGPTTSFAVTGFATTLVP